jgi:hypothetical protein
MAVRGAISDRKVSGCEKSADTTQIALNASQNFGLRHRVSVAGRSTGSAARRRGGGELGNLDQNRGTWRSGTSRRKITGKVLTRSSRVGM